MRSSSFCLIDRAFCGVIVSPYSSIYFKACVIAPLSFTGKSTKLSFHPVASPSDSSCDNRTCLASLFATGIFDFLTVSYIFPVSLNHSLKASTLERASSSVRAADNSQERIFHCSSGLFNMDSIASVHNHDCCETIDFVTLPTHSPVAFAHVLIHCTTFGATVSAHLTIALPVVFTHCPIAFPIGLANGIGASCPTFNSHAMFSARIGFVFSNSPHHLESSCIFSVCHVFSITFCTTGDTKGSSAEVTGCNAVATVCPAYGSTHAAVLASGFSICANREVVSSSFFILLAAHHTILADTPGL